jgi:hypothetical protein
VTTTHFTAALPVNQGGTGSVTQNFVDLSGAQTVGGAKNFSSAPTAPALTTTGQGVLETAQTVAASTATYAINLANGTIVNLTLTANCTLTFPSVTSGVGVSFTLELVQDGTGSRTVAWPAGVKWAGGVAPVLTTTAAALDILNFYSIDGGTTWRAFLAGSDVR